MFFQIGPQDFDTNATFDKFEAILRIRINNLSAK